DGVVAIHSPIHTVIVANRDRVTAGRGDHQRCEHNRCVLFGRSRPRLSVAGDSAASVETRPLDRLHVRVRRPVEFDWIEKNARIRAFARSRELRVASAPRIIATVDRVSEFTLTIETVNMLIELNGHVANILNRIRASASAYH